METPKKVGIRRVTAVFHKREAL